MSSGASSENTIEYRIRSINTLRHWSAYCAERFPVVAHGVLILSFYSSNQFLAHALTEPNQPMRYDVTTFLGCVTLMLFFLQLRIFDDHKDYVEDCRHFPHRVLQRGIVSLSELKLLAAIAIAGQLLFSMLRGPAAFIALLICITFSFLMLKEFFVGEYLKKHFLMYASTHMLIMPLLALLIYSFTTDRYFWQAPGWYVLYSFVGFFVAFNWEVSRKIRAPADEIAGLDSYTKTFGTYGAAYVVLLIRVIDSILVGLVAWHLQMSPWFYAWIIGLFFICLVGFFQYRFNTNSITARRMATYAGVYIVAFDLALAIELGRTHGIQLGV